MTTDFSKSDATPQNSASEVVHVSVFGSDDVKRPSLTPGHTVGQYLSDAGFAVEKGQTVSLNGQPVTDPNNTVVESNPGTVNAIVVTSRVANGRH
jgi:hypothetical protein